MRPDEFFGNNPNADENERRQKLLRLALTVMMLMLLLDAGGRSNHSGNNNNLRQRSNPPADTGHEFAPSNNAEAMQSLNVILNRERVLQQGHASNVTGTYFGMWSKDGVKSETKTTGRSIMQLVALPTKAVNDIHYVFGIMKLYDYVDHAAVAIVPLQGISQPLLGTVHLFSAPYKSQKLFIEVPTQTSRPAIPHVSTQQANVSNPTPTTQSQRQRRRKLTRAVNDQFSFREEDCQYIRLAEETQSIEEPTNHLKIQSRPTVSLFPRGSLVDWLEDKKLRRRLSFIDSGFLEKFSDPDKNRDSEELLDKNRNSSQTPANQVKTTATVKNADVSSTLVSNPIDTSKMEKADLKSSANPVLSFPTKKVLFDISMSVGGGVRLHLIDTFYFPKFSSSLDSHNNNNNSKSSVMNGGGGSVWSLPSTSNTSITVPLMDSKEYPKGFLSQLQDRNSRVTSGFTILDTTCTFMMSLSTYLPANYSSSSAGKSVNASSPAFADMMVGSWKFSGDSTSSFACSGSFKYSAAAYRIEDQSLERELIIYSIAISTICIWQIAVVLLQLRYATTQSTQTKMSVVCLLAQSVLDSVICVGHMMANMVITQMHYYSYLLGVFLLKLVLFSILEMRLIVISFVARFANSMDSSEARRQVMKLNIVMLIATTFFTLVFLLCYSRPILLVFVYYSYWIPQIVHSAVTGTKKAFHPIYLFSMGFSRLAIPFYFFLYNDNFLYLIMSPTEDKANVQEGHIAALILVLWTSLQLSIIYLQDSIGPRFFIPKRFLPHQHDYFGPWPTNLHSDVATGGRAVGESSSPECVICYNDIQRTPGSYMITPCQHIFHKDCLVSWIEVKMECPICRSPLPVYDDRDE